MNEENWLLGIAMPGFDCIRLRTSIAYNTCLIKM